MAKEPSRYERWKEKYSFDECELDNKEYGHYLSSYLRSQKKPLVLNLNGAWGTGKTVFLKQMYSNLRYDHLYPVIYIDAWKSDFSNDPLLVVISEMIEQFKLISANAEAVEQEKELLKVVAKFSKKLWNLSAIGLGTYLSGKTDNSAMVEAAKALTFNDNEAVTIGRNLTDNYKAQLSAIEDTKRVLQEYLGCLGGSTKKQKVFVLVDELDRCRPTYAIEMLETIKHFFSLEKFIFVVATDTNQLSHSIKAVYGSEFDGSEYLSRFFNRSAALPEPDKGLFANLLVKDTLLEDRQNDITIFGHEGYSPSFISRLLHEVSVMYNLSLRRMEQVFRKFESCVLFELDSENRYLDHRLLMQLIAEYDTVEYRECYDARKEKDGERYTIPNSISHGNVNLNYIEDVLFRSASNKFESLLKGNNGSITPIKAAYIFSWGFASGFSNEKQDERISLSYGLDSIQTKIDYYKQNSRRVQDAHNKEIYMILERYKSFINNLLSNDTSNKKGLYTRKDYFKAVELSSNLTND